MAKFLSGPVLATKTSGFPKEGHEPDVENTKIVSIMLWAHAISLLWQRAHQQIEEMLDELHRHEKRITRREHLPRIR
jgi:hypothetical protein